MVDVVDPATRSRMMRGIRATNTAPELLVRKVLHAEGLRFRIHQKNLPGTPDLVFPKYRAVIFVHGCFWHGHGCRLFKLPTTRRKFWEEKIRSNSVRDEVVNKQLMELGWRIGTVWECALKGTNASTTQNMMRQLVNWLETPSNVSGARFELDEHARTSTAFSGLT